MTLSYPLESMHKGGVAEQSDYHLSAKGESPIRKNDLTWLQMFSKGPQYTWQKSQLAKREKSSRVTVVRSIGNTTEKTTNSRKWRRSINVIVRCQNWKNS